MAFLATLHLLAMCAATSRARARSHVLPPGLCAPDSVAYRQHGREKEQPCRGGACSWAVGVSAGLGKTQVQSSGRGRGVGGLRDTAWVRGQA